MFISQRIKTQTKIRLNIHGLRWPPHPRTPSHPRDAGFPNEHDTRCSDASPLVCSVGAIDSQPQQLTLAEFRPLIRPHRSPSASGSADADRCPFFSFFKGHLLREQLHSKFCLEGRPVLIHSGSTTGKRRAAANREPVREEACRACTMRTIL